MEFDFGGYATRNDLLCADGRTIRKNAFKDDDGKEVSLVWNHDHGNPEAVLGHAVLENRDDGVYAYCKFNDTESGKTAKELVKHGDVRSLSIWANQLKQMGSDVIHGSIKELSLVLAGANPGAYIDLIMAHGDDGEDELVANYDESALVIYHSDTKKEGETEMADNTNKPVEKPENDKTIKDVFDEFTEEQKKVVYAMIGMALEENKDDDNEGGNTNMKHNIFDQDPEVAGEVLSHSEMASIFEDAKRCGSLRDAVIAHGIEQIDLLFPDAKSINNEPEFIKRPDDWVAKVLGSVRHTPFSRVKSIFADITADEARAKGYTKGKQKLEETIKLLKRTTNPTTVYKKQKLDRDDILDITDFNIIPWLKGELRMMLNEELARAYLIGDGRTALSDDKINEDCIRPIWKMEDLFTVKVPVEVADSATAEERAKAFIAACVRSRKDYKGSGNPSMFMPEDILTDCLLIEDKNGRVIYDTEEKLRARLRVKEIITVPVMENQTRTAEEKTYTLAGIYVNLSDYNVGTDRGGEINMFDDFDIDYNQHKYLMETRCSGTLVKPYSAVAIEFVKAGASA